MTERVRQQVFEHCGKRVASVNTDVGAADESILKSRLWTRHVPKVRSVVVQVVDST